MLTNIERNLLVLALDKAAQPGEVDNAAVLFIRKLRKRSVNVYDLLPLIEKKYKTNATFDGETMPFGKYKNEKIINIAKNDQQYCRWLLSNCKNITVQLHDAIANALKQV